MHPRALRGRIVRESSTANPLSPPLSRPMVGARASGAKPAGSGGVYSLPGELPPLARRGAALARALSLPTLHPGAPRLRRAHPRHRLSPLLRPVLLPQVLDRCVAAAARRDRARLRAREGL